MTRIISHRMTLADAPLAYQMFDTKKDEATKIVLTTIPRGTEA
jgi:threonine dehydrogenase-like Zn-dependent dehydrogenase